MYSKITGVLHKLQGQGVDHASEGSRTKIHWEQRQYSLSMSPPHFSQYTCFFCLLRPSLSRFFPIVLGSHHLSSSHKEKAADCIWIPTTNSRKWESNWHTFSLPCSNQQWHGGGVHNTDMAAKVQSLWETFWEIEIVREVSGVLGKCVQDFTAILQWEIPFRI